MAIWRFLPICQDDLDAIITIENRAFDHPWGRASFQEELVNPQTRAFSLQRDPHILFCDLCAFVFLRILMDEVHIMKLATAVGQRRQGLAANLTQQALSEACREGCCRAILEVRSSNLAAIRLYHRLGFETVGERKRYYRPTGEDALVMAKNL